MPTDPLRQTYPITLDQAVFNVIDDGRGGTIGLTVLTLNAATQALDPAGSPILSFVWSPDGGTSWRANPIRVRAPGGAVIAWSGAVGTSTPYYFYGFTAGSMVMDAQSGTPLLYADPGAALYPWVSGDIPSSAFARSTYALYQGEYVFTPGHGTFCWRASGYGDAPEHWVTTRPQLTVGYAAVNPPRYALGGMTTPRFAFVWDGTTQVARAPGVREGSWAGYYGPYYYANPVTHPHNPGHVACATGYNSSTNYAFQIAQSYDQGLTIGTYWLNNSGGTSARATSFHGLVSVFGSPVGILMSSNDYPTTANPGCLVWVEEALFFFASWGFWRSGDGGQTWSNLDGPFLTQYLYNGDPARNAGIVGDTQPTDYDPKHTYPGGGFTITAGQRPTGAVTFRSTYHELKKKGGGLFPDAVTPAMSAPPLSGSPPARFSTGYARANAASEVVLAWPDGAAYQCSGNRDVYYQGTLWHTVQYLNRPASGAAALPMRYILLRSLDLGGTWEQLPEPPKGDGGLGFHVDERTGRLWWGLGYFSIDGGQTWRRADGTNTVYVP